MSKYRNEQCARDRRNNVRLNTVYKHTLGTNTPYKKIKILTIISNKNTTVLWLNLSTWHVQILLKSRVVIGTISPGYNQEESSSESITELRKKRVRVRQSRAEKEGRVTWQTREGVVGLEASLDLRI